MKNKNIFFTSLLISALILSGCNNGKEKIETAETTSQTEAQTETTTENFVLSETELSKTNETKDSLEEKTEFSYISKKNNPLEMNVTNFNTQDSSDYSVKIYFDYSENSDYDYVFSDSDGYNMYQTSYFNYINSYGEEMCATDNIPSIDDIYTQCDALFNCCDEITDIKGEFEKDNTKNIVCQLDNKSFYDNFTSWSNSEKNLFAVYTFSDNEISSIAVYKEDTILMNTSFSSEDCDEEVEEIMEEANELFKIQNEKDNKENDTVFIKDEDWYV